MCRTLALVWLGGVAGWTLLEYLLHRFVFNIPRASPLSVPRRRPFPTLSGACNVCHASTGSNRVDLP